MKWLNFLLFSSLFNPLFTYAQGENNIWTFADAPSGNNKVVNFNSPVPLVGPIPYLYDHLAYGAAVCSPNGQLRFFIRLSGNTSSTAINNIFEANGTVIAGSNLGTGVLTDGCMPVVIPMPGHSDQYYIFYSFSNGLRYSLLDMSLNNGHGALVAGQKDVNIAAYGTIIAQKMTAIKGCDGVWLVVRSRVMNGYYSYHVTTAGLDTNKVVSEAGNFFAYDYSQVAFGFLKAALDGEKLAICGWAGVELYDFEKCSGKVKNARILEATGNQPLGPANLFDHYRYNGVCFSPDGSKLYVTQNHRSQALALGIENGWLYQYDLTQSTLPAIIASRTLVLTNQPSIMENGLFCNLIAPNPLGELKNGPDGKVYIDNGSYTCLSAGNVPAGFNSGPGFHVVNQPNLQGLACIPQFNAIIINDYTGNMGGSFFGSADGGKSYLQQDIVLAPPAPDTIPGQVYDPIVCFLDTMILSADTGGSCYKWDDGSTEKERNIYHSGTYFVRYFKDCNYTTDTFHANLVKLPQLIANQSCPDMHMGRLIALVDSDNKAPLNYIWRIKDGSILRQFVSTKSDTLTGVDTGTYYLEFGAQAGCDTVVSVSIGSLPKPTISASPIDTIIRYGDTIILHADGATLYAWSPSSPLDSPTKADPIARPLKPTLFSVIGINEYGCEDTAFVKIDIDFTMPDFVPNAFSPNGDGLNDVFNISNITYQKVAVFQIYNRFGQPVFSTRNGQQGWDGSQNGKPCDVGTYYYLIQLDYPNGKRKTYKGDLSLIR